jgi:hypothetical protein
MNFTRTAAGQTAVNKHKHPKSIYIPSSITRRKESGRAKQAVTRDRGSTAGIVFIITSGLDSGLVSSQFTVTHLHLVPKYTTCMESYTPALYTSL